MSDARTRVSVLFFASYREIAGTSRREIEVPARARVADLLTSLREDGIDLPDGVSVAVNRRYAPIHHELNDGDEVALVPPVAGG